MSEEHRVSDAEREAAVVLLRDASTDGRLTLEELGDRTGLAYAAATNGELERVTVDLPARRRPRAACSRKPLDSA